MSKLTKILSFSDYASGKTPVAESVAPAPAKVAPKAPVAAPKPAVAAPVAKKVIKESAFVVGDDFKVKLVLDIPQSIVNDYVAKVKKDTGKDALANFTAEEVAEELVRYIIKTKLSIENLPAALSVGEQPEGEGQADMSQEEDMGQEGEDIEFEVEDEDAEPTTEPVDDNDDPFKDETEEFEIDEDDDTEPVKSGDANDKMSFQATEVENVEKDSIELDAEQTA